jgi:hypothetical protein
MISGSKGKKIYNIFNSLSSKPNSDNTSSADFVGMYLKHISNLDIFQEFANLNAISNLEFIISKDDLIKYGTRFPAGKNFYETNIFCNTTTIWKKDGQLKKDIVEYRSYKDCNTSIFVPREDGSEDHEYGEFKIRGSFVWYRKHNKKSQRDFIYCKSPTTILSEVFGKFTLPEKALCKFNLVTIGRDPVLKRNNIWISKRRIHQLIKDGKIKEQISILRHIAKNI